MFPRLLSIMLAPLFALLLFTRWSTRRDNSTDLAERLALGPCEPARLWLHGASIGEVRPLKPMVVAALDAGLGPIQITTNSQTARDMVRGWALAGVRAQLAPIDTLGATPRLLRNMQPTAYLVVEQEFWPMRLEHLRTRQVALFGLSTRLGTARSPLRKALLQRAYSAFSRIWPMDGAMAERLSAIDLPEQVLAPNFNAKFLHLPADRPPNSQQTHPDLQSWAATGKLILLAASTHKGEDAPILRAFKAAHETNPALRLILAPRHPKRAEEIAGLIEGEKLSFAKRSTGSKPEAATLVYLADTLHEMDHWYHAAPFTLMGGTLGDYGGHTPVEPLVAGSLPIAGPSRANHSTAFDALEEAGALLCLTKPDQIGPLLAHLPPEEAREKSLRKGRAAINILRDETQRQQNEIVLTLEKAVISKK